MVRRSYLAEWVFVLSVVGYAPVGLMGALLDLEREYTSIPFRIVILLMAGVVLVKYGAVFHRWYRIRWLLIFWGAYLARLLWDWNNGVEVTQESLTFFVVTTLIPGIALAL